VLAEIGHRLGGKALEDVANAAKPDTILGWYRKLVARKFDGSKRRRYPGRPRVNSKDFIRAHMDVRAGTDFFTVEVLTLRGLVTYYVLFFIHLESLRYLIHDRDTNLALYRGLTWATGWSHHLRAGGRPVFTDRH